MKLRSKMLLLTAVVFLGFFTSVLLGVQAARQVRVGGELYGTIKEYKDLLEGIAILKADLNRVRAETLSLILETDADKIDQINWNLDRQIKEIDDRFDATLRRIEVEEKRIALQDARTTWGEFDETLNTEMIPAIEQGNREHALLLANSLQKMRYERFIEQVGNMVDVLQLEIAEIEEEAETIIRHKIAAAAGISGGIFLVILIAMLWMTRTITRPILKGVEFARDVAAGDLSQVLATSSRDETGDLTRSLNAMVTGLNGMVGRVSSSAEELDRISGKIYSASKRVMEAARMQAESVETTSSAMAEINTSIREVGQGVETLSGLAGENTTSVLEMAASVEEVAGNVETLSRAVEEVSSSIAEIAASIRQVAANAASLQDAAGVTASSIAEMDVSIQQVEQGASNTMSIAEQVKRDAESGKAASDSAMEGMSRIRRASQTTAEVISALSIKAENIGAILSVIDEVVDQINLLALNASIIAAQAGDHGKGFAVVAEEIRELADRTGGSSREIAGVVKGVQEETRRAVQSIEQADQSIIEGERLSRQSGEALEKIVTGVQKTTGQMGEVAKATREQANSSQMIRQAMEKVSEMVIQIAAATNQQDRAGEQIMKAAERMKALTVEVKGSTREQSKAGSSIARASEEMTSMIRQIKRACDEQTRGSEQVGRAVESIQAATAVNLESIEVMDTAVAGLQQQTGALQEEMKAFRTAERQES